MQKSLKYWCLLFIVFLNLKLWGVGLGGTDQIAQPCAKNESCREDKGRQKKSPTQFLAGHPKGGNLNK